MAMLNAHDIDRLSNLLALLGSDQMGERAAAAAKVTEFLRARSLDLHDIGKMLKKSAQVERKPVVACRSTSYRSGSHRMDAQRCLQSGLRWKPHERDFLEKLKSQRHRPSAKQEPWLDDLCRRMAQYQWETANGCF